MSDAREGDHPDDYDGYSNPARSDDGYDERQGEQEGYDDGEHEGDHEGEHEHGDEDGDGYGDEQPFADVYDGYGEEGEGAQQYADAFGAMVQDGPQGTDDMPFAIPDEDIEEPEPEPEPEAAEKVPEEPGEEFPEWDAAPLRVRLFSVLEPITTENMGQPPVFERATQLYHAVYVLLLAANTFALVMDTVPGTLSEGTRSGMKIVANVFFLVDACARAATFTSVSLWFAPGVLLDFATCIATLLLVAVPAEDLFLPEIAYVPPLRSWRFFLFTGLFCRTETFQDINLALRTVQDSIRSLLVFFVLMLIGLMLFATFVYLAERGTFNSQEQLWYRDCNELLNQCQGSARSPFQSIPGALWLIVQSLTIVGYGDATPTTTLGRFVTGAAVLLGVFTIAFPSMVLIGNLDQTRRDFFAQLDNIALINEYRRQMTDSKGKDPDAPPPTLAPILTAAPDEPTAPATAPTSEASFAFMGEPHRKVRRARRGAHWEYDPILGVLCDPADRLPVLSSVTTCPDGVYLAVMTLVLDDTLAQALASQAVIDAGLATKSRSDAVVARAVAAYGLDVALIDAQYGVRLRRRADVGANIDASVPLLVELTPPVGTAVDDFLVIAREALGRATLRVRYSDTPVTSWTWHKTLPITSVMIATTPFMTDLNAMSRHLAAADFWTSQHRKSANTSATEAHNVAYVTKEDLAQVAYPLFQAILTPPFTIRNASEFTADVVNMIVLHARELRFNEIPPQFHDAVFNREAVSPYEKVYELDVDYFRTNDWPLGTAVVEFSERRTKTVLDAVVRRAAEYAQPPVDDLVAFKRTGIEAHLTRIVGDDDTIGAPGYVADDMDAFPVPRAAPKPGRQQLF